MASDIAAIENEALSDSNITKGVTLSTTYNRPTLSSESIANFDDIKSDFLSGFSDLQFILMIDLQLDV